jgi:hypothetical protein
VRRRTARCTYRAGVRAIGYVALEPAAVGGCGVQTKLGAGNRLHAHREQADELRERCKNKDDYAPARLAQMLINQGNADDAIATLQQYEETVDMFARMDAVETFIEQGHVDKAMG